MPIAAVPQYLGQDFKDASPGLRFGMYLKLWGQNLRSKELLWTFYDVSYEIRGQQQQEREVREENKVSALKAATVLTRSDKANLAALSARQTALAAAVPDEQLLRIDAQAISPFTTGLGNEHPLENGFAFLNPYGLPYLPGSSVKGVLRQAARELAGGDWGDCKGWSAEKTYLLKVDREEIGLSLLDVLFGLESEDGSKQHVRGALTFWDVIPRINGESLLVEIMTPHQGHYYQQKQDVKTGLSTTPHDSGQPVPISYLTVPPGSGFTLFVTCDPARLRRLAPDLVQADQAGQPRWKQLMLAAIEHAFSWLGFGAKTAVGYGAMRRDKNAEEKAAKEAAQALQRQQEAVRRASLTEAGKEIFDLEQTLRQRHEALKGKLDRPFQKCYDKSQSVVNNALATASAWTAEEKRQLCDVIMKWLPKVEEHDIKNLRKKLRLNELDPPR